MHSRERAFNVLLHVQPAGEDSQTPPASRATRQQVLMCVLFRPQRETKATDKDLETVVASFRHGGWHVPVAQLEEVCFLIKV